MFTLAESCWCLGAPALRGQDTTRIAIEGERAPSEAQLVEEVRIGSLAGDEAYSLGNVGGVAVTHDGTIWVSDRHWGTVRRYSPSGQHVGDVGRRGEGPGEFKYPGSMRVLGNSAVAVWDDGLLRVSIFDLSGVFQRSFEAPTHMIRGPYEEFEVDSAGNLYLVATDHLSNLLAGIGGGRWYWLRMTTTGEVLDTIFHEDSRQRGSVDRIRTFTALSPVGYRVTARNDQFRLFLHKSREQVTLLERSWDPIAYERAERAEKQRLESWRAERAGRAARRIPRHKPAFSALMVDSEGRLWVTVAAKGLRARTDGVTEDRTCGTLVFDGSTCATPPASEWLEPQVFEVIEPSGNVLWTVRVGDPRTEWHFARGSRIWVVEYGPLDEQYVVQYRLSSQPGR
jgi:hypothetical protein